MYIALYTVLVIATTYTAQRTFHVGRAWWFNRGPFDVTVNHVCDEPEFCPADSFLEEWADLHRKTRIELLWCLAVLALTFAGCLNALIVMAR